MTEEPLARSEILQEPLELVALDRWARGVAEAAAELFENAAGALDVDLAGNLHRVVVAVLAAVQRTAERIGAFAAALLASGAVARAIALTVAVALLHGL